MFNSKKIAGFFLFFTIMGSAVIAQTPQMPQQQQQQKVEVTDSELSKFANAFQQIQMISQQAQQEMTQVVQEEGMDIQRFNEIHQASINPEMEVEVTEEEKKQHQNITAEIEKMQSTFQGQMEKAIADQDLTIEKYEEIINGLQADPELQERLRKAMEG